MIRKNCFKSVLLITGIMMALFLLQPLPEASSALLIDDFSDAQPPGSTFTQQCLAVMPPGIGNGQVAAAAIGGFRFVEGSITNGPAGLPPQCGADTTLSIFVLAGTYNYGLLPTDEGIGKIVWSGAATYPAYSLPAGSRDFLANGDHIKFTYTSIDQSFSMRVDLYTDATHASRAIIPMTALTPDEKTIALNTSGAGAYDSYFSVQLGAAGHVNFNDVREVHMDWVAPEALDFTLTDIVVEGNSTISCVSKTLNGLSAATIAAVPPGTNDLNVSVTVRSDATSTASTTIRIRDTLTPGTGWEYLGPTTVTCSNGALPCPALTGPTITATTLEWTSGANLLPATQTMTLTYKLRVTDLAASTSKSNCVSVKKLDGDTYPACISQCTSTVTARSDNKVPSMSEWGVILTSILLCLGGVYLMRRKRGSAV